MDVSLSPRQSLWGLPDSERLRAGSAPQTQSFVPAPWPTWKAGQLDWIFIKINHQLLAPAVGEALLAPGIRSLLSNIEKEGGRWEGGGEGGGEGGEDGVQPLAHHDLLPATAEASLPVLPGGAGGSHKLITISRTTRDHHGLVWKFLCHLSIDSLK